METLEREELLLGHPNVNTTIRHVKNTELNKLFDDKKVAIK